MKIRKSNPKIKLKWLPKRWITFKAPMTLRLRKFVNWIKKSGRLMEMWSGCMIRYQISIRNCLCRIPLIEKRRIEMSKRLNFWKGGYKQLQKMPLMKNLKEKVQNHCLSKSISRVDRLPKYLEFPKRSLKSQAARSL